MSKDRLLETIDEEVKEVNLLVKVTVRKTMPDEEAADRVRFFLESESNWVKKVESDLMEAKEADVERKKQKLESLIKQYINSLPKNYGQMLLEIPNVSEALGRLMERVHDTAYRLGRYKGKQAYHLMQFKDELDIIINDLGVVIVEKTIGNDGGNTIEKYNEVIRLLKEIREELKGK